MELAQAVVLGLVQGTTEFLPISSTGHLILVPALLGWADSPLNELEFAVALHLGTLAALLGAFWRQWLVLVAAALESVRVRSLSDPRARLAWLLAAATVPGAAAGVLLETIVETALRSPAVVGLSLLGGGLLLGAADRWSSRQREESSLSLPEALAVGLGQALALVPGVSRSGMTMTMGLAFGLSREAAARFSFLLSAPIIAGAGAKQALDLWERGIAASELSAYALGIAAAALSGYLAIRWLLAYVARHSLLPFVVYRVVAGAAVIVLALGGRI